MTNNWGVRRWTRHSLVLVVAGALYIGIGFAFFTAPPLAEKDPSLKVALQFLSLDDWGYVFVVVGALSIFSSVWPIGKEKWGYSVLTALSSAWSASYILAVMFYGAPKISLLGGLTWGLLAFIWWAISGLISPEFIKVVIDDEPT